MEFYVRVLKVFELQYFILTITTV